MALAAGFADGLGCGGNTKAALMRIGFGEMRRFIASHGGKADGEAYWESCGLADLITTCYGGRNRKVAELFAKGSVFFWCSSCLFLILSARGTRKFADIEKEAMNGQMLQGPGTLQEVVLVLRARNSLAAFPLFAKLHRIVFEGLPVEAVLDLDN